jgi:hypothetical protein
MVLTTRAVKWRGEELCFCIDRRKQPQTRHPPYSPQTPDKNRLHHRNSHCSFQIFHLYGYCSKGGGLFTKTSSWSGAFNIYQISLTFKNLASYIYDGRTATLQMLHFIYIFFFFSKTISTEYFKHAAHTAFFSSKCRLFHDATFFCSCIIHILHTECAKI